jgi:methyl-accepting chemotaxis protein
MKRYENPGLMESVHEISAGLPAFAESLEETSKNAEPSFIEVGRELQTIYSDAGGLEKQTLETAQLIAGESEENVLADIGGLAGDALEELKSCQTEVSPSLSRINEIVKDLDDLPRVCAVVEKIGKFLNVVGVNIGVESARSNEAKEMFKIDIQEIRKFSSKVIGIAENIRNDSKATRASLTAVHKEISAGLEKLLKLADDADQAAQHAVQKIELLMEYSVEAMKQASAHSQEISSQVGEIVVGIQLHDSMRQRVEHMIKSFHDVLRLCSKGASASGIDNTKAERLGSAYLLLDLQVAQLKQIITEVNGVYEKSTEAFGHIYEEVGSIVRSFSAIGSEHAEKTLDPFADFKSKLDHLGQLLDRGETLLDQIRGTATQASEIAALLSNYAKSARSISFEIHIMAINAILSAMRLGEHGKTLTVLAQEVKDLSNQSNEFVNEVEDILGSINSTAGKLETRASEEANRAKVSLDESIQAIARAYSQFKKGSSDSFERAEALKNAISDKLNGHLCELEKITQVLSPWASEGKGVSTAETDKLTKRYTMHQERKVHKQLTNLADDSIDDFGENIDQGASQEAEAFEEDSEAPRGDAHGLQEKEKERWIRPPKGKRSYVHI